MSVLQLDADCHTDTQQGFEACLHFATCLWGRCNEPDGDVVLVDQSKKKHLEIIPVTDLERIASVMVDSPGCYIKVNPMDGKAMRSRARDTDAGNHIVGTTNEVKTVIGFALDCDANKPGYLSRAEMLDCLDQMPKPPSMIVNSDGPEGGFHAYWLLELPYRIANNDQRRYISRLSARWQEKLSALTQEKLDMTANIDRLLRYPGPRASGNMVGIYEHHPERLYSLRELTIPASGQTIEAEATRMVQRLTRDSLDVDERPISQYLERNEITPDDLLTQYGGYDYLTGPYGEPAGRSHQNLHE